MAPQAMTMKNEKSQVGTIADYLKQPYARTIFPEPDGTFRAEIQEFPGCIAIGDTAPEALTTLEEIAESWLEAALAHGQSIPEPFENLDFSGRLVLRLPKSMHKKAARAAERDGVSLNQFIVAALSEQVGERVDLGIDRPKAKNLAISPLPYIYQISASGNVVGSSVSCDATVGIVIQSGFPARNLTSFEQKWLPDVSINKASIKTVKNVKNELVRQHG